MNEMIKYFLCECIAIMGIFIVFLPSIGYAQWVAVCNFRGAVFYVDKDRIEMTGDTAHIDSQRYYSYMVKTKYDNEQSRREAVIKYTKLDPATDYSMLYSTVENEEGTTTRNGQFYRVFISKCYDNNGELIASVSYPDTWIKILPDTVENILYNRVIDFYYHSERYR